MTCILFQNEVGLIGENTEKIWAHRFLEKPKMIEAGGPGRAVSPPSPLNGVQGDALVNMWVQIPWTIFLFFSYKAR